MPPRYGDCVSLDIIYGTNDKPAASAQLVRSFNGLTGVEGDLTLGFPVLGQAGSQTSADAIFLAHGYQPLLVDLVEGTEVGDFVGRQDQLIRLAEGRLTGRPELWNRRSLKVPIEAMTYAPGLSDTQVNQARSTGAITNGSDLSELLESFRDGEFSGDLYSTFVAAIQNLSTLRRSQTQRIADGRNSLGARLHQLENQIATLDPRQSEAVLETIEGVQRIRGLAGSGKTIVLALKAAYLHSQHPDWRIAVSYFTRSLEGQFRRLIRDFVIAQIGAEPDWENLRIVNAWGGSKEPQPGLYAEFCQVNEIEFLDFRGAQNRFGYDDAFAGACASAVAQAGDAARPAYDAILIDEAQDLPAAFLRLAWLFVRDPHRLVYAYDELQNLSGAALPDPVEIFGADTDGQPRVTFSQTHSGPRNDIVLEMCYRNSRPILTSAHAIGFGVYREPARGEPTPLVQIFDHADLWTEIGYEFLRGRPIPNTEVRLARTPESSPLFLEQHSATEELIQFLSFDTAQDQNAWVADQISQNVEEDDLRHSDIMVINPNPLSTRDNLGPLRKLLAEKSISSHLAGVDTSARVFFAHDQDSITFTGVFRAKGNEAGMVYVVNANEGLTSRVNSAQIRNRLFTAITRSKAWVRVLGVGPDMEALVREFERVRDNDWTLDFVYPTDEERERIRILHREVSPEVETNIERQNEAARALVSQLRSGTLYKEDLDDETKAQLRELLSGE